MDAAPNVNVDTIAKLAKRRAIIRSVILLPTMALVGGSIYFLLPLLLPLTRPATPPGGWVIEPPSFLRACVALYSPAFIIPLTVGPLMNRYWRRKDARDGFEIKYPKLIDWSTPARAIKGLISSVFVVLLIIVLVPGGIALYLTGFVIVCDAGITDNIRFQRIVRGYDEVEWIALVPQGKYWEYSRASGPFVCVRFKNAREFNAGAKNGLAEEQVQALAKYISSRSHQQVQTPPGLR